MGLSHLHEPIKGEPTHDDVSEELDNGEHRKYDPISEPFCIVILPRGLQSVSRCVRWINETDKVADELRCESEDEPKTNNRYTSWNLQIIRI